MILYYIQSSNDDPVPRVRSSSIKNNPSVILSLKHIFFSKLTGIFHEALTIFVVFFSFTMPQPTVSNGPAVKPDSQKQAFCCCPGVKNPKS